MNFEIQEAEAIKLTTFSNWAVLKQWTRRHGLDPAPTPFPNRLYYSGSCHSDRCQKKKKVTSGEASFIVAHGFRGFTL